MHVHIFSWHIGWPDSTYSVFITLGVRACVLFPSVARANFNNWPLGCKTKHVNKELDTNIT